MDRQTAIRSTRDPRPGEGILLPEGYEQNTIKKIKLVDELSDELGRCIFRRVEMEDRLVYDVKSFEPHKRKTDIAVSMTVPWLTEPSGYNTHMALILAKLGYAVDLVSAERNVELKPHIGKSAHNQLEIAQYTAEVHDRDKKKIIATGVSRAAMIALLLTALADTHDMEVEYGDYIVPCYPKGFTIFELGRHAVMPISETQAARHILDFPLRTLQHYPNTFSVNPKKWLNHMAALSHLMSGITGDSVQYMPEDLRGHLTAYLGDPMSQGENWQKKFADFPNMEIELINGGGHLSCATPATLGAWKGRFYNLAEELYEQM